MYFITIERAGKDFKFKFNPETVYFYEKVVKGAFEYQPKKYFVVING